MNSDKPIRQQINDVVEAIMINDGPDRHTDGSDVITDYICALLKGEDERWKREYNLEKLKQYEKDKDADSTFCRYPELA